MTTLSVEAVARRLVDAARKSPEEMDTVGHGLWADEGAFVRHTPPAPIDGLMKREPVLEAHRTLTRAIRAALPDFHFENVRADIEGDVIQFYYDQMGTKADGTKLAVTVNIRMLVRDGCIVDVTTAFDHDAMAPFLGMMPASYKMPQLRAQA